MAITMETIQNDVVKKLGKIIAYGEPGRIHLEIPGYKLVVVKRSLSKPPAKLKLNAELSVYRLNDGREPVANITVQQFSQKKPSYKVTLL